MEDNESERERLALRYSEMSDAGLSGLAADAGNLTDVAREMLAREMNSRGIQIQLKPAMGETELQLEDPGITEPRQFSGPLAMAKRFRDLTEAFVAKSVLDSAGIDCFLADENIVRIDWFLSNGVGGAKLMVRPEDLEEATKLLDESANSAALEDGGKENSSQGMGAESE